MPELEHEPELIDRLARVHEGNAVAHLKRAAEQHEIDAAPRMGWSQHLMLAASGFVISASYWSLIAPSRAVAHYRQATEIYRALGHSYWMVLALASASENDIASMPAAIDETPTPSPQTVAFAMIGNEVANADRSGVRAERLNEHWRHAGNPPIGRLGIPLDYYARCAQAMRAARTKKDMARFIADAAAYLHRAAEVIRSASHDRFHWLGLQSTILPAEPEAVAIATAMSMMSHALFDRPISEIPSLDAHGRRLVEIGDELRDAGRG
jgi:hypothetical protein